MSLDSYQSGQVVSTPEILTDRLTLNGVTTQEILTRYTKDKPTALLSAAAVASYFSTVDNLKKTLDPTSTFYKDFSVITTSLTGQYFDSKDDWSMTNWLIQDNCMYGIGGHDADNSLIISKDCYTNTGIYCLALNVLSLPSGKLDIYKNDTWITAITSAGTKYIEVAIDDITNDLIKVKMNGVAENEKVILSSYALYFITPRFYNYLVAKVKDLSSIDPSAYVKVVDFDQRLQTYVSQFQAATNLYLEELRAHENTKNPHNVTPEMIGAAPTVHSHNQYVTSADVNSAIALAMTNYALKDHIHDNYVTNQEVNELVTKTVKDRMDQMITVASNIVTAAPSGMLPGRYATTDINAPLQILVPNGVFHVDNATYDLNYGNISTNIDALKNYAPDVFGPAGTALLGYNFATTPVNFRIEYHCAHRVKGYRVYCEGKTVLDWSVYSGNTTFIHKIIDATYTAVDGYRVADITLDEVIETTSLAFVLQRNNGEDIENFRIEIVYDDGDTSKINLTKKAFSFCLPSKGANRVIEVAASLDARTVTPAVQVNDTPCYVFAKNEVGDTYTSFDTTFIPPEYNNVRKGKDVLHNKYEDIAVASDIEAYTHPAFGTLTLRNGATATDSKLTNIYSEETLSWCAADGTASATIEQTFNSDNIVLRSYLISWRNEEVDNVPDTWTLTIEGKDSTGKDVTVVYDSVEQYFPLYSVEDDDIVYQKDFDIAVTVKKITLTLTSAKENATLHINNLSFGISERWYAIAQNVMYLGLTPVSEMCLGYAMRDDVRGWVPTNLCLGKYCVIPVNNMEPTIPGSSYEIPNPFFSQDVLVCINNYALQDSDGEPGAYVDSISADKIVISTLQSFRHGVAISRAW